MTRSPWLSRTVALLLWPGLALSAQVPAVPRKPAILPIAEETRLALSAAPEYLRNEAGVVALTDSGFVAVRPSRNGFTCVVNRDHPLNLKPTCYDAEGAATVLPKVRFVGTLLLQGIGMEEIDKRVAARFASGEFIAPRRAGVAYMLSTEIRNYNPQTGRVDGFPPHMMFYAPNVTNEDVGVSWEAHRDHMWLPFVGYQGPHGFLIVLVGDLESASHRH